MVSIEEGADELPGLLLCLIYLNPLLYQFQRVNHKGNSTDHLPIPIMFLHKLIKPILTLLRDDIPDLSHAGMAVIE